MSTAWATPSRRRLVAMAGAAAVASILPGAGAIGAVSPPPLPAGPVQGPLYYTWKGQAFRDGLSLHFRHREAGLWGHWRKYLQWVEADRDAPDASNVNSRRWYLSMWLRSVAAQVPLTDNDREVQAFAFRMIDELLCDFPDVPWRPDVRARLEEAREWGRALARTGQHPSAIRLRDDGDAAKPAPSAARAPEDAA